MMRAAFTVCEAQFITLSFEYNRIHYEIADFDHPETVADDGGLCH
jgi:hypothetical protein